MNPTPCVPLHPFLFPIPVVMSKYPVAIFSSSMLLIHVSASMTMYDYVYVLVCHCVRHFFPFIFGGEATCVLRGYDDFFFLHLCLAIICVVVGVCLSSSTCVVVVCCVHVIPRDRRRVVHGLTFNHSFRDQVDHSGE